MIITDNRLELYKQGLGDKEIAEKLGLKLGVITVWRTYHKLPRNEPDRRCKADAKPRIYVPVGNPMEETLTPSECKIMWAFLSSLVTVADRCRGKKDVMGFIKEWRELYGEGKLMVSG
jgi:hypothetical protein